MATIYIDKNNRCYTSKAKGRTAVETDAFDGKCAEYIEGYCFRPASETGGEAAWTWKRYEDLERAQRVYEREQLAGAVQTIDELCDYIAEETV